MRSRRHGAVSFIASFLIGCTAPGTHYDVPTNTRSVDRVSPKGAMQTENLGNVIVRSIVYRQTEFPLSMFFSRLARGDFQNAFHQVSLRYKPSNTDDKALRLLLDHGVVPALIIVSNSSDHSQDLEGLSLTLKSPSKSYFPISESTLPSEFKKIYWPGATIDAVKITLIITAVLAVVVAEIALVTVASGGRGAPSIPLPDLGGTNFSDNQMKRHSTQTVGIEYDASYLFESGVLAPGQTRTGLVFFQLDKASDDTSNLRIQTEWRSESRPK